MKTSDNRRFHVSSPVNRNASDSAQIQDEFDDLVVAAAGGDARAIGAIAVALGPTLREEARVVLGEYADEDWDVLQDFLVVLLEGRSRFRPAHGRAVTWLCRTIRAMAQTRRLEHDRRRSREE